MRHLPDVLAPFVPTPPDVVERMLTLASVGAGDLVYDLGCGDGRIPIAAAQRHGARAVGIDTELYAMEATLANIALADVGHLVEFRRQDALTVDLRPASVVMLYLSHWANARFKPLIQGACRPGTRVVSHSFPMPDWVPARTETDVDIGGQPRTLFLWIVGLVPCRTAR